MTDAIESCDPLLAACLSAEGPEQVEEALRAVVMGTILPASRRHVRVALFGRPWLGGLARGRRSAQDAEDLVAETLLRVLTRIHLLREGARVMPIRELDAFIGASARNAVATLHRERSPGRTLVAKSLDYHLNRMPDVEVRATAEGVRTVALTGFGSAEPEPCRNGAHTRERIRHHLRSAGGTLSHEALVRVVASDGSTPQSTVLLTDLAVGQLVDSRLDPPAAEAPPDHDVIVREELSLLWAEIVRLPTHQRRALLLGMEDIALLPVSGTASLRRISEVMGLPVEQVARWWRELPMSDARIAELLQTTETRVRNFRKCARERLGRRMIAAGLRPVAGPEGARR